MKALLFVISMVVAASASADQFKTVSVDMSSKNYDSEISYPELNNTSVPGYKAINKQILEHLADSGCDAKEAAESQAGYTYYGTARIVGLNKKYVGYELTSDDYCGGAHPNYTTYYMTYDAQTGEIVDMNKEAPYPSYEDGNFEAFDKYQVELATIMYNEHKAAGGLQGEDNCYSYMNEGEAIGQIATLWPYIAGLAKNEKVVLTMSPPHVAVACSFSVRVDYSKVEKFISKNGKIAKWLK